MRIGVDITPLSGQATGVGRYTRHMLAGVIALAEGFLFKGLSSGLRHPDTAGISLSSLHIPLPTRLLYKWWGTAAYPQADRLLGGVDIYHATNYFLPPVARARRVLTIYDLAFLIEPAWASPRIVGPFSKLIHRFAHQADAVITCSKASKSDIVRLLGVPESSVHVACGAAVVPPVLPGKEAAGARAAALLGFKGPFMLFVGTLEPRKNISGLLRAFAGAAPAIPHRLVLAGRPGWNMEMIDAEIASLGLSGRVARTGYVASADLAALYRAADAFLFPSHYEGFGLPVLEAMANGCPVITSLSSSLPEVAGDAALFAAPEDTATLAAAIERLAEDEPLRDALREKGRARARMFTWEECAGATLDVYRSLA